MNIRKKIFISGLVQGVFFRDSTCQKGNELNLVGAVRNLRDGRVEVQVLGNDVDIQLLIKWLEIGPKYAKVSNIEVLEAESFDMISEVSSDVHINQQTRHQACLHTCQQRRQFVVRPTI